MITSVSGCLSLLAIGNRAACASIVDNNGLDLIIALLKTSAPGVALQVCAPWALHKSAGSCSGAALVVVPRRGGRRTEARHVGRSCGCELLRGRSNPMLTNV